MAPPKTHRTEQRSTHVQSAKSMSTTEKNVLFFLLPLSYGPINLPKKKKTFTSTKRSDILIDDLNGLITLWLVLGAHHEPHPTFKCP